MRSLDTKRLTIDSPLGKLTLTSAKALTALDWNLADTHTDKDPVLEEAARQRSVNTSPGNGPASTFRCNPWHRVSEAGLVGHAGNPLRQDRDLWRLARQLESAPRDRGRLRAQSAAHHHSLPSRSGSGKGGYSGWEVDHQGWLLNHEMAMVAEPVS